LNLLVFGDLTRESDWAFCRIELNVRLSGVLVMPRRALDARYNALIMIKFKMIPNKLGNQQPNADLIHGNI
jgi:hypothetical protein